MALVGTYNRPDHLLDAITKAFKIHLGMTANTTLDFTQADIVTNGVGLAVTVNASGLVSKGNAGNAMRYVAEEVLTDALGNKEVVCKSVGEVKVNSTTPGGFAGGWAVDGTGKAQKSTAVTSTVALTAGYSFNRAVVLGDAYDATNDYAVISCVG